MTFGDMEKNLREDKYKPKYIPMPPIHRYAVDHVFDEQQSVAWNRKEVIRRNREYDQAERTNRKIESDMEALFSNDLKESLKTDYDFSTAQAEYIYQRAYDEGHANGYYEVLDEAEKLADFIKEFLAIK